VVVSGDCHVVRVRVKWMESFAHVLWLGVGTTQWDFIVDDVLDWPRSDSAVSIIERQVSSTNRDHRLSILGRLRDLDGDRRRL
jgi:hypothetical protein